MPATATAETIATKEQAVKDLNSMRQLKTELVKLFTDYKKSKSGFLYTLVSPILTDRKLTNEKLLLVDKTIKFINEFDGTKKEFIAGLRDFRTQNSTLSTAYEKYHTNLDEDTTDTKDTAAKKENKGFRGKSDLADAFHTAVGVAEKFGLDEIHNSLGLK